MKLGIYRPGGLGKEFLESVKQINDVTAKWDKILYGAPYCQDKFLTDLSSFSFPCIFMNNGASLEWLPNRGGYWKTETGGGIFYCICKMHGRIVICLGLPLCLC